VLLFNEKRVWQSKQNRRAGHLFGSTLRWGFQPGKLGAFFSAFPTGFAATGKSFDLKVLVAGFGKLLAGACADVTQWIRVFRTALKQLSCEGRDPRAVARYHYCRGDHVDIALRQSRRDQTLTAASRDVTCF
jgi:hypothetical protein